MIISRHPYLLMPLAVGAKPRAGTLLRIKFEEHAQPGFADCHPWPELGDRPLSDQLRLLEQGILTPLTERSLGFARSDAEARSAGRWLLQGLQIPRSHYSYSGMISARDLGSSCEQARASGFREIKLKVGREPGAEIGALRGARAELTRLGLRLRLDFNERLPADEATEFLARIDASPEWIDWLEDPVPYNPGSWAALRKRFGIRLAIDRPLTRAAGRAGHEVDSFDILVAKPAVEDPAPIARLAGELGKELVVTSYLDHPLGTAAAAWTASLLGAASAGLITHTAYEPNAFSSRLAVSDEGRLVTPAGTGFGWDVELAALSWECA